MYRAELMGPIFYGDAVYQLKDAERARKEAGYVGSANEVRQCRTVLLLLAFAFEAFLNEELRQRRLHKEVTEKAEKEKKYLNKKKLSPPGGRGGFPKTLTRFAVLCQHLHNRSPNFAIPPFLSLDLLFCHRNEYVHPHTVFEPVYRLPTGTVSSGWGGWHQLELAHCLARDCYEAIRTYYKWCGTEESANAAYVGSLTEFQVFFLKLIGRKHQVQSVRREVIRGLVVLDNEEVSEDGSLEQRRALRYHDRKLQATVKISVLPLTEIVMGGGMAKHSVSLAVHPETATCPMGGSFSEVTPVEGAPNLRSGLNEILPRIRDAYCAPERPWTDYSITEFLSQ